MVSIVQVNLVGDKIAHQYIHITVLECKSVECICFCWF